MQETALNSMSIRLKHAQGVSWFVACYTNITALFGMYTMRTYVNACVCVHVA